MVIYRYLEKKCLCFIRTIWTIFIRIHEMKNIHKKKYLYKKVKLTKEQKKQIDEFYLENYGKKISYKWHQLYTSYTGKFDYKYIPEYIYSTKLELINNSRIDILPFENKNLINSLFKDVSNYIYIPKTYLMRVNGIYFDENYNPVSENDAINIINTQYREFIIKISIDTGSGKGVKIISLDNNIDIKKLFKEFGNNFVVQELIKQSESINKIYSKSINTLRVITYLCDNKICVAPIVLRIGQGGNCIDNAHAGGIFIAVDNDGYLFDEAFTEYQKRYTRHPDTNFCFKGYQLPNIKILREEIVKLHKQLPMVKFISWDIATNSENKFSLVEINLHSQAVWISQMAHGKGFFENNTAKILQMFKK